MQVVTIYWADFREEILQDLNIKYEHFNPILLRVQRTGCYLAFRGYADGGNVEEKGETTPLFAQIYKLVSQEKV